MHPATQKAINEVFRLLQVLDRNGSRELHLRAYETALRLHVGEPDVWEALAWFADTQAVRLSTWSEKLRREVTFKEWPAPAFFNNPEDGCYVRLRPAGR